MFTKCKEVETSLTQSFKNYQKTNYICFPERNLTHRTLMPDFLIAFLFLIGLFCLELLYFRLAIAYKIIDKPNKRSSHTRFTIRGGGVIFPIAVLGWAIVTGFQFPWFISGLLLISLVSFVDDLNHIHSKVRFLFQFLAVAFILFQLSYNLQWYWYLLIIIVAIAAINAWNFMDGINGITGGYSLITVGTLYYININIIQFADNGLLVAVILALIVFNFFNFRKKAQCFAGDVGSVSIAFIIVYLVIQLVASSQNMLFIGLILLYGLDTATTIFFRLLRKENIFEAHRSHFYQFIVNEKGWPHLAVSAIYAIAQFLINLIVIALIDSNVNLFDSGVQLIVLVIISGLAFLSVRFFSEGKGYLTGKAAMKS